MTNVAVIGSQWGDEGKGKIVDWLSERADLVVRFQGGHNAGHTLVIDGVEYFLQPCVTGSHNAGHGLGKINSVSFNAVNIIDGKLITKNIPNNSL